MPLGVAVEAPGVAVAARLFSGCKPAHISTLSQQPEVAGMEVLLEMLRGVVGARLAKDQTSREAGTMSPVCALWGCAELAGAPYLQTATVKVVAVVAGAAG
jgi:hypothetical protein